METPKNIVEQDDGGGHGFNETPEKLLVAGFEIEHNTLAGLAFTALCGLYLVYLFLQRRSEDAQLKEAYSYENLRARNTARSERLEALQAEHDKLAEEEQQRKETERLEKQKAAQAAKAKRMAEELQGGHRVAASTPAARPRQAAPTQRQQEMRQIESAFQQAMASDLSRQSAAAVAAQAEQRLLDAAAACAGAAALHVAVLPAKLARRSIAPPTQPGDLTVMVRTSPADSAGVRHVTLKCAADTTLLQLLAGVHAVLPGTGVLGKVLMQAHPRKQLASGDDLRHVLLAEGGEQAAEGGALAATLAEAGVAHRAMLMLRGAEDA